jgi:hypothetical protein
MGVLPIGEPTNKRKDEEMKKKGFVWTLVLSVAAFTMWTLLPTAPVYSQADDPTASQIRRGYEIAPVPLDLRGKNRSLVGLGSYIVNAQAGCNDCHTHPSYAPNMNPFLGQPEGINTTVYLSGGRQFGPFTSRNLTPDPVSGLPADLTFNQFLQVLRTGKDFDLVHPQIPLLQVMPWPVFSHMTDRDIAAIYEYLSAIPSLPDNPKPGP